MNGASAAIEISDILVHEAVGAVRIGKVEGNFVVNPGGRPLENTDLDLIVAGTADAILMVEAGANEVSEAEILDALDIAHDNIKKLLRRAGRAPREGRQGEDRVRGAADRRGPLQRGQGRASSTSSTPPPR
jgi:polyribonucleotide nucleotidyltransferase